MYHYQFVEWLAFFYLYCFLGWCFESTYVSIKNKKIVNRGFIRGPFLPLYGSGAIMMLVVSMPFQQNLLAVYIAGCIGATVLEFVTGVSMEALFKVRYWDYSNVRFNYKGHVCLGSSLAWGGLTILMTQFLHKPVEQFVLSISYNVLIAIIFVLTIIIVIDFTLSFKAALDLRDILVAMEKAKEELERMQRRLDVIVAIGAETKEEIIESLELKVDVWKESRELKKAEKQQRTEELLHGIEERLDTIKLRFQEHSNIELLENVKEEIIDLKLKYYLHKENRTVLRKGNGFLPRNIIRSNPTIVSAKFREVLEELKEAVNKKEDD